jgi:unsaturated rhamnogalacturonyl hydrolase
MHLRMITSSRLLLAAVLVSRMAVVVVAGSLVLVPPPLAETHGLTGNPTITTPHAQPPARAKKARAVLDNFYNNEWRVDSTGTRVRFHYLWHDTANSGFSILGRIIRSLGATTDTLCRKPDANALGDADVYIIVDPDTPQETEHPESIDSSAADAIARWVARGGMLVLLGNDHGNCDLAGLSVLGSRFGIRFHEDSRNRVVGNAYQTGTFDRLPAHPIFKNVRKVYLKEISTLSVAAPARPLLVDSTDVIIATARYGKGSVFAVGDPWFYNEYMDARKLPAEYDNARVAENLFRWLLQQRRSRR